MKKTRPIKTFRRRAAFGFATLAALGVVASLWAQESREWRSQSGKTVATGTLDLEKTLLKWDGESETPNLVYFRDADGKSRFYRYRQLSDDDQTYVDEQLASDEAPLADDEPTAAPSTGSRRMSGATPTESTTRPLAAVPKVEAGVRRAVLVAVDDYVDFSDLRFASADVELAKSRLLELGFAPENIVVLSTVLGRQNAAYAPTQANIERELQALVKNAGPDDMLFAMFTGHGFQTQNFGGYETYVGFAPQDAKASDETTVDFATTISLSKFFDDLEECDAKFKWTVVDACREKIGEGSRQLADSSLRLLPLDAPDGVVVLQSCGAQEFSYESAPLGHGLFTHRFFKEGLSELGDANGDGVVTFLEAATRAQARVKSETSSDRARYTKTQTPYFRGDFTDFPLGEVKNLKAQPTALAPPTYEATDWNEPNLPAGARFVKKIGGVEFAFRWCPPGKFKMGSPFNEEHVEEGRHEENEKQHEVTLSQGFWILETELTQKMWTIVMRENATPERYAKTGPEAELYPVLEVLYDGFHMLGDNGFHACAYIDKINAAFPQKGWKFELPTEAQWEYACRAGTETPFSWGETLNGDMANCDGSQPYGTSEKGKESTGPRPVRSYPPNPWGIYDMHGNVSEWCHDYYVNAYEDLSAVDPICSVPKNDQAYKTIRGGNFEQPAVDCRSARRMPQRRGPRSVGSVGLRIVVVPTTPQPSPTTQRRR